MSVVVCPEQIEVFPPIKALMFPTVRVMLAVSEQFPLEAITE